MVQKNNCNNGDVHFEIPPKPQNPKTPGSKSYEIFIIL